MASIPIEQIRNRLLRSLPAGELDFIEQAEPVHFEMQEVIAPANSPVEHVCFVESGIISVLAQPVGERLEIGIIGREGMTGAATAFGVMHTPHQLLCQSDGDALKLPVAAFIAACESRPALMRLAGQYLYLFGLQTAQTAYASAELNVEARLARWLLMVDDRTEGFELPLTHEFLAAMLAVRRPGVTTAIHVLEGAGMIKAQRGRLTIRSRSKLKELADEAYGPAEAEYDSLIGPAA